MAKWVLIPLVGTGCPCVNDYMRESRQITRTRGDIGLTMTRRVEAGALWRETGKFGYTPRRNLGESQPRLRPGNPAEANTD